MTAPMTKHGTTSISMKNSAWCYLFSLSITCCLDPLLDQRIFVVTPKFFLDRKRELFLLTRKICFKIDKLEKCFYNTFLMAGRTRSQINLRCPIKKACQITSNFLYLLKVLRNKIPAETQQLIWISAFIFLA